MEDDKEVSGSRQTYVEFLRSLKASLERDQTHMNEINAKEWLHPEVLGGQHANSETVGDQTLPGLHRSDKLKVSRTITFNDLYGRLKQHLPSKRSSGQRKAHSSSTRGTEPERE